MYESRRRRHAAKNLRATYVGHYYCPIFPLRLPPRNSLYAHTLLKKRKKETKRGGERERERAHENDEVVRLVRCARKSLKNKASPKVLCKCLDDLRARKR